MRPRHKYEAGFTLMEMMIALLIFTIISGAAFSLMAQHEPVFKQQQNMAALNIGMRNAVAQMQVDVVNGGEGYYTGFNVPDWPVSVAISNNVVSPTSTVTDCHSGTTYGSNCFDSFTVITVDPNTTPVPVAADGATVHCYTTGTSAACGGTTLSCTGPQTCSGIGVDTTDTSIYALPPTGVTAATYAASFNSGDHVLVVKGDNSAYTQVTLTAAGTTSTVSGTTYVLLTHTATNGDGTNSITVDPTGMTTNSSAVVTNQYQCASCPTYPGYIARLIPIQYRVDTTTDSTNPTLDRTVLTGSSPTVVPLVNQVIGMKVGATIVGDGTGTYQFDSSKYSITSGSTTIPYPYDYTKIRSVMVSMIGRTSPNAPDLDPSFHFQNSFDGGRYMIQGISVVVNPRNTMF